MILKYNEFITNKNSIQETHHPENQKPKDVSLILTNFEELINNFLNKSGNIFSDILSCENSIFVLKPSVELEDPFKKNFLQKMLQTYQRDFVVDYVFMNGAITINNVLGIVQDKGFKPVKCYYDSNDEDLVVQLDFEGNIQQITKPIKESFEDNKVKLITEGAKVGFAIFPLTKKEMFSKDAEEVFAIVKKYYTKYKIAWDAPLALNFKKPKKIKIRRSLNNPHFLKYITDNGLKLDKETSNRYKTISIDWGDGSRGGLGAFSKGYSFEANFENDLKKYVAEGFAANTEYNYKDLTEKFVDMYLQDAKDITIQDTSSTNTTRELTFGGDVLVDTAMANDKLSDIIVKHDDQTEFVSLKYGETINYIGCGVTKILKAKEIASGIVIDKNGLALLEMLGIENSMFCRVFNEYGDLNFKQYHKTIEPSENFKKFVASGFGKDYTIVHLFSKKFEVFEVNDDFIKNIVYNMSSITLAYGGITGSGKRVDLIFTIGNKYKIIISIRNQSGGIYPTHITSLYSPIKVK